MGVFVAVTGAEFVLEFELEESFLDDFQIKNSGQQQLKGIYRFGMYKINITKIAFVQKNNSQNEHQIYNKRKDRHITGKTTDVTF
ncbi:hypothetical protein DERP_009664 [Dermatophagoides pteronyssinus]|uniref:Uncharacterized protein n=1 Tax=Dermatophagoides pteronyssinus TaxID=6956 RepID=A0ABQ8JB71_DERPT|nr:hypothetical protein DERP_009664 [Dermatophagoides pteronyssinus]